MGKGESQNLKNIPTFSLTKTLRKQILYQGLREKLIKRGIEGEGEGGHWVPPRYNMK